MRRAAGLELCGPKTWRAGRASSLRRESEFLSSASEHACRELIRARCSETHAVPHDAESASHFAPPRGRTLHCIEQSA